MGILSLGRKAWDQLRQTAEAKELETIIRKAWYKLRQTDEEKELEKQTQEAVRLIAGELELPSSLYEKRFPSVRCDPFFLKNSLGETFYRPLENMIVYGLPYVPRYYVFEEAGHFLHFCSFDKFPPPAVFFAETLTKFFFSCNVETVGFFCSRFSGDDRENDFSSFRQVNEVLKHLVEEGTSVMGSSGLPFLLVPVRYEQQAIEEICRGLYRVVSAFLASPPTIAEPVEADFSSNLLSTFLSRAQSWHDECLRKYPGFQMVISTEEVQETLLQQGVEKLSVLPPAAQYDVLQLALLFDDHDQLSEDVSHLVGYNLGAALFRFYESDPQKGKELVQSFMQVPCEESLPAFFRMHRELHDVGYSPLSGVLLGK